jgi:hypothetical protein
MKMEQIECSETSAFKIQMPENYPEENIYRTRRKFEIKVSCLFVCFLLGNFPASEFYIPTFRNTICSIFIGLSYEDGTDRVFRNVGI